MQCAVVLTVNSCNFVASSVSERQPFRAGYSTRPPESAGRRGKHLLFSPIHFRRPAQLLILLRCTQEIGKTRMLRRNKNQTTVDFAWFSFLGPFPHAMSLTPTLVFRLHVLFGCQSNQLFNSRIVLTRISLPRWPASCAILLPGGLPCCRQWLCEGRAVSSETARESACKWNTSHGRANSKFVALF